MLNIGTTKIKLPNDIERYLKHKLDLNQNPPDKDDYRLQLILMFEVACDLADKLTHNDHRPEFWKIIAQLDGITEEMLDRVDRIDDLLDTIPNPPEIG